ncbi:MAG: hypothetical protein Q9174_002294 [Haloplaca sp. 1 TL-2023]
MQCHICQRSPGTHRPFNCLLCARDAVYGSRLRLAQVQLAREAAATEVEKKLKTARATTSPEPSKVYPLVKYSQHSNIAIDPCTAQKTALEQHFAQISEASEHVRTEIARLEHDIVTRRAGNMKRRKDLAMARSELGRRIISDRESAEKTLARIQRRWNTIHTRTIDSQLLLCREAASLFGLHDASQQSPPAIKTCAIGGLPIFSLKELNSKFSGFTLPTSLKKLTPAGASPTEVTTICTNLVHVVHLISHYLALRLPAEMTLPHGDHPLPTVLPPTYSYMGTQKSSQNLFSPSVTGGSPSASRASHLRTSLRPHALSIKKQLPVLVKDDPLAYMDFVKGVTLLAWNIAWLCKTQGFDVGDASWEEVCDMDKNLQKLFGGRRNPSTARTIPKDLRSRPSGEKNRQTPLQVTPRPSQHDVAKEFHLFGPFSHNTALSNLAQAPGAEYMRGWRLRDPDKLVERVKYMLQCDRTGAGWEILDGKEWETESPVDNQATQYPGVEVSTIVVDATSRPMNSSSDEASRSKAPSEQHEHGEVKSTSGWTKLKSR